MAVRAWDRRGYVISPFGGGKNNVSGCACRVMVGNLVDLRLVVGVLRAESVCKRGLRSGDPPESGQPLGNQGKASRTQRRGKH